MTYSLHPEAASELEDAFNFYREQGGARLAYAFLAEFERVATLLVSNPDFGTPSSGGRRSFPLRRFPYSLIYRATTVDVCILALAISTVGRVTGGGEYRDAATCALSHGASASG
ncbi:type II toxin-antitoxin system RelE/ParE family toxin [Polaromonas sp.]|uniref:type II toxin-antitoxin system RelE/ParE family toxin n=1 Tax=Polaromonas sp. TaxID=1869339 RepID=UPI00386219F9